MAAHDIPERYGVRPVRVDPIGWVEDPPLTEGQIEEQKAYKRNAQLYNCSCRTLVNALDDKIFLTESLAYVASLVTGRSFPILCKSLNDQYEEVDENLSLREKKKILDMRRADVLLTLSADTATLNTLNKVLLSRGHEHSVRPEPKTPEIFYRAFRSSSHSRYDKHLGFRSSRQPFTPPSNYCGPLHKSSLVDKDELKNHCEGVRPSDLIAMSDSPARVLQFIKSWKSEDLEGEMIAVINVSKLLAMRVLFSRTTTLCTELGIKIWATSRSTGLNWVNKNYWVSYRWIPAGCIESCISVEFLRSACEKQGIGEKDYDQQISLDDLLCQGMKSLSI